MQRPDYRSGRQERAVKVYTVCDESRYLIVKNVPALGCIEELLKLFGLYGDIEEYRMLDEEDCEPFTDVYWIKYAKYHCSRFAKRKLDNYIFLGNSLQVSYAPDSETLVDTKNKLEERRRTVLNRIQANLGLRAPVPRVVESVTHSQDTLVHASGINQSPADYLPNFRGGTIDARSELQVPASMQNIVLKDVESYEHMSSASMNATVQLVREKLNKISDINLQSSGQGQKPRVVLPAEFETKGKRPFSGDDQQVVSKKRPDNRRRI